MALMEVEMAEVVLIMATLLQPIPAAAAAALPVAASAAKVEATAAQVLL
jgi:hypothetical protein